MNHLRRLLEERRQFQAAAWYHRSQEKDARLWDWFLWRIWSAFPGNRRVFDKFARMDRAMNLIPSIQPATDDERAADRYDGSISVAEWRRRKKTAERNLDVSDAVGLGQCAGSLWRFAAVICLLVIANVLFWMLKISWDERIIETAAGEWRTRVLEDQSRVTAGPATKLSIELDERERVVYLASGKALFNVASDASRPFVVQTGLAKIRAVGTRFGVTRTDSTVVVTLAEGELAVMPVVSDRASDTAEIRVLPGDQVSLFQDGTIAVRRVNASEALARAEVRPLLRGPIESARLGFNRRHLLQIHVTHPEIAGEIVDDAFDRTGVKTFSVYPRRTLRLNVRA